MGDPTLASEVAAQLDAGEEPKTPEEWQKYWEVELKASKDWLKDWHQSGDEIVRNFLDERKQNTPAITKWNFFPANVKMTRAHVFGKIPKADVERRFPDPENDEAPVAAAMCDRLLNTDFAREDDPFCAAAAPALSDYPRPPLVCITPRY